MDFCFSPFLSLPLFYEVFRFVLFILVIYIYILSKVKNWKLKTKIQKIITEREKTKPNIMWKRKGKGNKEKWIVIIQWEERRSEEIISTNSCPISANSLWIAHPIIWQMSKILSQEVMILVRIWLNCQPKCSL